MSAPPFKVKAVFEYSSPHDDDLHFPNGQIITVTDDDEEDWYTGEYVDASGVKKDGIFPRNFVEKYEPTAPPRPARTARPKKDVEPPPAAVVPEPAPVPVTKSEIAREEPAEPVHQTQDTPVPAPQKTEPTAPVSSRPAEISAPAQQPAKPVPSAKTFSPPPVKETPSVGGSFKDRIAAFNKAAPPPVPFKPGGSGGSSFIKKPFVAPPPSKNAYVPTPREQAPTKLYRRDEDPEIAARETENQESAEKAGLLPGKNEGDAEDQPKPTSLKERIALLQKQQMEQAARHADAAQKKEKPKRPVKKRTESHNTTETHEEAEALNLERQESHDTVGKKSFESTREEPNAPRNPQRRKSSKGPPAIPSGIPRDSFGDGNDADMSGAGDETEGPEELSTGRDEPDEKPRARAPMPPVRAPGALVEEPHVIEEEGAASEEEADVVEEDEGEEEEEEEDVDPEVRRKEEIRARMAKMSGGMGMYGMFGPPGGMPMPGPAPATRKTKGSEPSERKQSGDYGSEDVGSTGARAPPVPVMTLPGLSRVRSLEDSNKQAEIDQEEDHDAQHGSISAHQKAEEVPEVDDFKPAPPSRSSTYRPAPPQSNFSNESLSAPPIPGSRPAPPPVPTESRPVLPLPSTPMSPSAGSESDDELSLHTPTLNVKTPTSGLPSRLSGLPTLPGRLADGPSSPRSPTSKRASYFGNESSPTSPTTPALISKRASRVPPIPGAGPGSSQTQSRAPPPPPPGQLSRSSTGDARILPSPKQSPEERSDEEVTEYEGDYDTDIASATPHKDALKAHARDSSVDEEPSASPQVTSPAAAPPPLPPAAAPRALPPPLPSLPPPNSRQSGDMPRAAPPPPPQKEQIPIEDDDDDEYDPYRYTGTKITAAPVTRAPSNIPRQEEEDLYSTSPPRSHAPQERAAPPPPPREPVAQAPNRALPRQSADIQRTQSSARRSTDLGRMTMDTGFMANDIDLAQSSLWWTQKNGVPPVFSGRRDILYETEESTSTKRGGKTTVTRDLYILFQDYSQTVISSRFDPQNLSDITIEQRHELPPARLRQDQLEDSSERFGRKIFDAVARQRETVVADGSPHGLINELLKPFTDALLPVGTRAYGALVYSNMANASVSQLDEIRPGDIITLRNAKLQGKHGPMHAKYSVEVGAGIGHVGVVAEWDGTKKKVRAWEQGRESKKVRLESYKLDDLRSGEVKIWRVMPRSWVGWEGVN